MKTRTFDAHLSAKKILSSIDDKLLQKYKNILNNTIKKAEENRFEINRDTIKNILFLVLEKEYVGYSIPAKHKNSTQCWQVEIKKKMFI